MAGVIKKAVRHFQGKQNKKQGSPGAARSMPKKKPTRVKTSNTMGMGMKRKKGKRVRGAGRG